ncbi:hypothetical protein [Actinoallomurus iriomotensis]|uniref:Uncharacterized protein n=1 Tax=Actinoallomurus iriomotensis TaxID=478107 RepID=A0A9W6SAD4_9ACTN|nr:hypothetical protein [Actinoallomurus iriomotensis]GLY88617.1 hypothetical protein Airi02_065460 [Actinoallomurus iriomotensis]
MAMIDATQVLGNLPQGLRAELIAEYAKITRNYVRGNWEAAELNGGRFCEIVYTVLRGHIDGSYPVAASKPQNFPKSCEALAQADKISFPQSIRLGIPRVLVGLYEIRNNRGVGHVGGDVDANHMDAIYVLHSAQWVMSELIRIFHKIDVAAATRVVDALTDRTVPVIWTIGEARRILDTSLSLADRTLLLLYGEAGGTSAQKLATDLKQERFANYKRVLKKLDEDILVEYNDTTSDVEISPKGEKYVEENLLQAQRYLD